VVDHGITGYIFENDEEAVFYIKNYLQSFSRTNCRRHFEYRFSAKRMARDYINIYNNVLNRLERKKVA